MNKLKTIRMKDVKEIIAAWLGNYEKYLINNPDQYTRYRFVIEQSAHGVDKIILKIYEDVQHYPSQVGDFEGNLNGEFEISIKRKVKNADNTYNRALLPTDEETDILCSETNATWFQCYQALCDSDRDVELARGFLTMRVLEGVNDKRKL